MNILTAGPRSVAPGDFKTGGHTSEVIKIGGASMAKIKDFSKMGGMCPTPSFFAPDVYDLGQYERIFKALGFNQLSNIFQID